MIIAFFDIGYKNFAISIEKFDVDEIHKLNKLALKNRYIQTGEPTSEFQDILDKIYNNGEIIFLDVVSLTELKNIKQIDNEIFKSMTLYLDSIKQILDDCQCFVIEQQMKSNPKAQKLEQHCFSYFSIRYLHEDKTITLFPSSRKTQVLGAPKKMTKPDRKKWASSLALEILNNRHDDNSLSILKNKLKKDDIADCIVMCQAFKIRVFIDKIL